MFYKISNAFKFYYDITFNLITYVILNLKSHLFLSPNIQDDSKRWTQLKSKRYLNTRQTVGCVIQSSLLALPVDLGGLRSNLS